MALDYIREKLQEAVDALVTGDGDLNERLVTPASVLGRRLKAEDATDVPQLHRQQFNELFAELERLGNFEETVPKLKPDAAKSLAKQILSLFKSL